MGSHEGWENIPQGWSTTLNQEPVWFGCRQDHTCSSGKWTSRRQSQGRRSSWKVVPSLIHSEVLESTVCIYCFCFFPCGHSLIHFSLASVTVTPVESLFAMFSSNFLDANSSRQPLAFILIGSLQPLSFFLSSLLCFLMVVVIWSLTTVPPFLFCLVLNVEVIQCSIVGQLLFITSLLNYSDSYLIYLTASVLSPLPWILHSS